MGLFDSLFDQQGVMGASGILGNLPPWMTLTDGNSPVLPPWMTTPLSPQGQGAGFPGMPQDNPAAIPQNAQPASLQLQPQQIPQMQPQGAGMWTPPDSNPDSPPLGSPFGPPMGAPQMPQQTQGMGAMAQAPMPQGQPQSASMPSLGGAMGGLGSSLFDFGKGLLMGQGTVYRDNAVKALVAQGVDPNQAYLAVNAPTAGVATGVLQSGGAQTSDIKEFEYAKKNGFKGTFLDWMSSKRAGAGEYGLNPIWGTDAEGNPSFIQPGKNGQPLQPQLPQGFKIARDPIKVEGPTGTAILDPQTRQQVGFIPKDVTGAASQKAVGTSQGQAISTLPQAETSVNNALKTIESLRTHPGLDVGTGLSSKIDPRSWVPGQPGYDFQEANKQAQGQSFMVAREALKGAGQVTDFEGKKGEEAIANLNTAQSKEQYLKALENLQGMITASYENLKKKAQGSGSPSAAAAAPADPLGIR